MAVVIRIPETLNDRLREYAWKSGCDYQDVILFSIVRYLEVVGWLYGVI